jgi:dephospho-CoA kinase
VSAERRFLLVVGRSCSGKSTFGDRAAGRGALFIEASEVLRRLLAEARMSLAGSPASSALAALGFGAVAERAIELVRERREPAVVISGFRTVEELDEFTAYAPHAEVVYLHAPVRLRYDRCGRRSRLGDAGEEAAFRTVDGGLECSLLTVARQVAAYRILNTGSLADFHRAVDAVLGGGGPAPGLQRLRAHPDDRGPYVMLRGLADRGAGRLLTDAEAVALGRYRPLAHLRRVAGRWRGEVTPAGLAYVRCVERMVAAAAMSAGAGAGPRSSSSA